jgi:hypothetical protein
LLDDTTTPPTIRSFGPDGVDDGGADDDIVVPLE